MKITNCIKLFSLTFLIVIQHKMDAQNNSKLGGNVWSESDASCLFTDKKGGGFKVKVELWNEMTILVDTTVTDSFGFYKFENLAEGSYQIVLPKKNFKSGASLYGMKPCSCIAGDDDVDNDNNGSLEYFNGDFMLISNYIQLKAGTEPSENGNANYTADFCLTSDCQQPNPLAIEFCDEMQFDYICDLAVSEVFCSKNFTTFQPESFGDSICGRLPTNMTWLPFIAGNTTSAEIEVELSGCTGGYNGGRAGILSVIDCKTFKIREESCSPAPCQTGTITLPLSNLRPGAKYLFWIDGCGGSECSYSLNIKGDYSQVTIQPTELKCYYENTECDTVGKSTDPVYISVAEFGSGDNTFYWKITYPSGNIEYYQTQDSFFKLYPFTVGQFTVELTNVDYKCGLQTFPIQKKIVVIDKATSTTDHQNCQISIIPNPTYGRTKVTSSTNISHLAIYSVTGKQLYSTMQNTKELEIDVSSLAAGVYVLKVLLGDNTKHSQKLIIY